MSRDTINFNQDEPVGTPVCSQKRYEARRLVRLPPVSTNVKMVLLEETWIPSSALHLNQNPLSLLVSLNSRLLASKAQNMWSGLLAAGSGI